MKRIKVGDRYIGENEPAFIIAEIGINHNGDIDLAKKMVIEAKNCGADAVKFQKFTAQDFISDPDATYLYRSQGRDITESMLEMFKRYEFSKSEWKELIEYCISVGVIFFVTPQNPSDLDFILSMTSLPIIKVGSDDLTNISLLEYYAGKRIPMIISAGMAYASEIEDAVAAIRRNGNDDIIVLHCVSSYPANADELNLRKIPVIRDAFGTIIGYSDHSIGNVAAICSIVLGAKVIEKHFTLDRDLPGPDHWFSCEPAELKELVKGIRHAEMALGNSMLVPTPHEQEMRKIARRSIIAMRDIKSGDHIRIDDVGLKRPGTGLPPKFLKYIVNTRAKINIKVNDIITFDKLL